MSRSEKYYKRHIPPHVAEKIGKIGFARMGKNEGVPVKFCSPFSRLLSNCTDIQETWFEQFDKWEQEQKLEFVPHLVYLYGEPPDKKFAFVRASVLYDEAEEANRGQFRKVRQFMIDLRDKVARNVPLSNAMERKYAPAVEEFFEDLEGSESETSSDDAESSSESESESDTESEGDDTTVERDDGDIVDIDLDEEERRAEEEYNNAERAYKRARIELLRAKTQRTVAKLDEIRTETAKITKKTGKDDK